MSCCGRKTPTFSVASQSRTTSSVNPATGSRPDAYVYFQYLGNTSATVLGTASGKRYQFDARGDIKPVDVRDRRALAHIPQFRQVQRPW